MRDYMVILQGRLEDIGSAIINRRDGRFYSTDADAVYDHVMERAQLCFPNVWLGVSVEDQDAANTRIPLLLQTPAAVRWISAEPLLGPISFVGMFATDIVNDTTNTLEALDWVVVGGESGAGARPMHPDWARSLRDQCAAAGTPFLFKQWGEWLPMGETMASGSISCLDRHEKPGQWQEDGLLARIGKKAAGRLLDGVLHDGYPEVQP
jgi:protein gp37